MRFHAPLPKLSVSAVGGLDLPWVSADGLLSPSEVNDCRLHHLHSPAGHRLRRQEERNPAWPVRRPALSLLCFYDWKPRGGWLLPCPVQRGCVVYQLREQISLKMCFRCLEFGYIAKNRASVYDRSEVCSKCDKKGHIAKYCDERLSVLQATEWHQ